MFFTSFNVGDKFATLLKAEQTVDGKITQLNSIRKYYKLQLHALNHYRSFFFGFMQHMQLTGAVCEVSRDDIRNILTVFEELSSYVSILIDFLNKAIDILPQSSDKDILGNIYSILDKIDIIAKDNAHMIGRMLQYYKKELVLLEDEVEELIQVEKELEKL